MLEVKNLTVAFRMGDSNPDFVPVTTGIDLNLEAGATLGIVGESGSGKSVTSLAIMGLLPKRSARVTADKFAFLGKDLLTMPPRDWRTLRGREVAMIFQDPMTSLNPLMRCGEQIAEVIRFHQGKGRHEAKMESIALLEQMGIPNPDRRYLAYPYELSGGMRQRVMIAMALSCRPKLLIADEPTTALDVTIQAQILRLIRDLQKSYGMALILITHDLGIVQDMVQDLVVMYAGRVVERGKASRILQSPSHPYTLGLLKSIPSLDRKVARLAAIEGMVPKPTDVVSGCRFHPRCYLAVPACQLEVPDLSGQSHQQSACLRREDLLQMAEASLSGPESIHVTENSPREKSMDPKLDLAMSTLNLKEIPLLEVIDLSVEFGSGRDKVQAVKRISFTVPRHATLGLVGESGSGKTTVGRAIVRLLKPKSGCIRFDGVDLNLLHESQFRPFRKRVQMIFQDPYSTLDPRLTIRSSLKEALELGHPEDRPAWEAILESKMKLVGLDPVYLSRFPHEFSGGQRQRIGIARALCVEPEFLVCDEPVSSLDVSIQAQILNLLMDLQAKLGLSYLFISHDLRVVKHIAQKVAVMNQGQIVEIADTDIIYRKPAHAFTRSLLDAIPGRLRLNATGLVSN